MTSTDEIFDKRRASEARARLDLASLPLSDRSPILHGLSGLYVLPCLVVYIAMARLAEGGTRLNGKPAVYGLILSHTVLMAALYSLFIAGKWSG